VFARALDFSSLPRIRPAGRARLADARVLIGLLLAMLVFAGGLGYWTVVAGPREVVALERDVPAGAPLAAADLGLTRVRVAGALAEQLVTAGELPALVGRQAGEPLHAGQLLMRAQLARRPAPAPGEVLVSVPLKPEAGPGPSALPGSHVRVLATLGRPGGGDATTMVVLPDAEVTDVVYEPRSALLSGGQPSASGPGEPVVLRVLASEAEAEALARAKVIGTLEVVLLAPKAAEGQDRR
jgi:Flp pilus assembly protein CpaB